MIEAPPPIHRMSIILGALLIAHLAMIGAWDLLCYAKGWSDITVSSVLRQWVSDWPLLLLFVGLILGHLFWR